MNLLTFILSLKRCKNTDTEREFINKCLKPIGCWKDGYGNYFLKVGDSPVMWSCHIDTVHTRGGYQKVGYNGSIFSLVKGNHKHSDQCLGGDDGGGAWMLLKMIEAGIPGLYAFHREEETGGHGSRYSAANHQKTLLRDMEYCIAFDRRGKQDLITHQRGNMTCSDAFGTSFINQLSKSEYFQKPTEVFKLCKGGVFTDSANYADIIPECTNLSIGYFSNHSTFETLDFEHLHKLYEAILQVDLDKLTVMRKPGEKDAPKKNLPIPYVSKKTTPAPNFCDLPGPQARNTHAPGFKYGSKEEKKAAKLARRERRRNKEKLQTILDEQQETAGLGPNKSPMEVDKRTHSVYDPEAGFWMEAKAYDTWKKVSLRNGRPVSAPNQCSHKTITEGTEKALIGAPKAFHGQVPFDFPYKNVEPRREQRLEEKLQLQARDIIEQEIEERIAKDNVIEIEQWRKRPSRASKYSVKANQSQNKTLYPGTRPLALDNKTGLYTPSGGSYEQDPWALEMLSHFGALEDQDISIDPGSSGEYEELCYMAKIALDYPGEVATMLRRIGFDYDTLLKAINANGEVGK